MTMKRISGFTILELMLVLVIASILLLMGVPSMQDVIKNNRLVTINNELVSSMQVARSEAIKQSAVACVCPSSTAGSAAPACDASDNWEAGWIAFTDTSDNCQYEPGDNDVLLKIWDGTAFANTVTVRNTSANINAQDFIRFNSRGIPSTTNGISLQGMFKVCDDRGLMGADGVTVLGRGIVLTASGSIRTSSDAAQIVSCL